MKRKITLAVSISTQEIHIFLEVYFNHQGNDISLAVQFRPSRILHCGSVWPTCHSHKHYKTPFIVKILFLSPIVNISCVYVNLEAFSILS